MLRRLFCILLALAVAPTAAADAKSVFAKAAPSVVVVVAQDGGGEQTAQGSGVVVGEGVAVTNCHVIENAAKVSIRQAADSQAAETYLMNAEVVARDEDNDLCLLYAPDLSKPPAAKTAAMGNAKNLVIGEEVYAIGAPQGLELSLSRGIVAQLRGVKGKAPIVQTDAAISPGSSGGGLFNENGELVGVTTFGDKERQGLNFAMPVEDVAALSQGFFREKQAEANRWKACTENPRYECVIGLAKEVAHKDSSVAQGLVAEAQAEVRDIKEAVRTAQSIDDVDRRAWTLRNIATTQAKLGDTAGAKWTFNLAVRTAQQIDSDILRPSGLKWIADAQAKIGDVDGAKQTAQKINDKKTRTETLSYIAKEQVKVGDITAAKKTFDVALRIAREIGDKKEQAELLANIAEAQAKAGDASGANETFNVALRAARQIDWDWRRDSVLRDIVKTQSQTGDIASAKQNAQNIGDKEQRAQALSGIAMAQAKAIGISDAQPFFDNALREARQADNIFYAKHNNDEFRNMEEEHVLIDIVTAQAEAGNIHNAHKNAQQIGDSNRRGRAIFNIAYAQVKAGDISGAKYTAQEIDGVYDVGRELQDSVLRHVVTAQIKNGHIDDAKQTALQIDSIPRRIYALTDIATGQSIMGDISGAKQTIADAFAYVPDISEGRGSPLNSIGQAQADVGDFVGAMQTVQLIDSKGDLSKIFTLVHIAKILAKQ